VEEDSAVAVVGIAAEDKAQVAWEAKQLGQAAHASAPTVGTACPTRSANPALISTAPSVAL
jgi:hypothetical protein